MVRDQAAPEGGKQRYSTPNSRHVACHHKYGHHKRKREIPIVLTVVEWSLDAGITIVTLFITHLDGRREGAGPAGGEGGEEMVLDLSPSPPSCSLNIGLTWDQTIVTITVGEAQHRRRRSGHHKHPWRLRGPVTRLTASPRPPQLGGEECGVADTCNTPQHGRGLLPHSNGRRGQVRSWCAR